MKRFKNADDVHRGDIIIDDFTAEKYLVLHHNEKKDAIICLTQSFNKVAIGLDWITKYFLFDRLDMDKFASDIVQKEVK